MKPPEFSNELSRSLTSVLIYPKRFDTFHHKPVNAIFYHAVTIKEIFGCSNDLTELVSRTTVSIKSATPTLTVGIKLPFMPTTRNR